MSSIASSSRPSSVTGSFVLWLITVILGVVGSVILLVVGTAAIAVGAGSRAGSVLAGAVIAGAVVGIVIALIELLIVFKMRQGRNWARIVLLVLAILQVIGNLTQTGSNNWSNWLGLVAVVIATVLMFVPASNYYFRRNKSGLTATAEGA